MFRALCQPLSSGDLSDILSRLVETVAEQGEDMQVTYLGVEFHFKSANVLLLLQCKRDQCKEI